MDRGSFSATVAHPLLRFNGKLFKGSAADDFVLPLQRRQQLARGATRPFRHTA